MLGHSHPDEAATVIARKTPAPATKSPAVPTAKQSPLPASRSRNSASASAKTTDEHDDWDTETSDELAEAKAYAPTRRRRSNPKRVHPKRPTATLIVRTIWSSVTLVILWGVSWQLSGPSKQDQKSPEPEPSPARVDHVAQVPQQAPPKPIDQVSFVSIQTQVKGARVLIDGEPQGLTPLERTLELKPGEHRFEVVFGKSKQEETVHLIAGQTHSWPTQDFSGGQIAETCKRSVCLLRTPDGHGSGFLVQDQQTIVTAAHVIDDVRSLDDLEFVFSPSADKSYPSEEELKLRGAQLIHFDRAVDVAILRLKEPVPADRQPLRLSEERVELQTRVIAIGNPGYGKGRYLPLDTSSGVVTNNNPLMTDSNVKGGYSGGPVFGAHSGEVVGITSAKLVVSGIARGDTFTRSFLSHVFLVRKALQAWNVLNTDEQTARAETVWQDFTQQVSDRRVFQAAVYLATTSDLYHTIASRSADLWKEAYRLGGFEAAKMVNRALDEMRRSIKKDFNPELETLTDRYFKTVLNDQLIDTDTRAKLEQAHREFEQLQKDATKLEGQLDVRDMKTGKSPKREKTFEYRVDTAKENLDKVLKPLLKDLADKLAVEDYSYPRLSK